MARKFCRAREGSKDDLSYNNTSSSFSTFNSPRKFLLRRGNSFQNDPENCEETRFLTRTRLRPGGPKMRPNYSSQDPQSLFVGTPLMTSNRRMFNGIELKDFEGVTRNGDRNFANSSFSSELESVTSNFQNSFATNKRTGVVGGEPLFPVSSAFYGTMATPILKKMQNNGGLDNNNTSNVQMFRTRVIYADVKDDIGPSSKRAHEASVWD